MAVHLPLDSTDAAAEVLDQLPALTVISYYLRCCSFPVQPLNADAEKHVTVRSSVISVNAVIHSEISPIH